MEKGYYKPEIEEFCVGFEYEYLESVGGPKWVSSEVFSLTDIFEDYFMGTTPSYQTRVKFLDREDIEMEGWKFNKGEIDFFEKNDFKLFWFDDSTLISIDRVYTETNGNFHQSQVFRGCIKNCTEFRKLLKQLMIEKV